MLETQSTPFVYIEGIENFRDIGGYPVKQDIYCSIRKNYIYRSADPSYVTPSGQAELKERNINHFFDLRSTAEIERNKSKGPSSLSSTNDVEWIRIPIFADEDYSMEKITLRFKEYARGGPLGCTKAYKEILNHAGSAQRRVLLHIRDKPKNPFVIHCSAGKDRTGVLVAVILSLAGVDDESIANEYQLTDQSLAGKRQEIVEQLINHPAFDGDREAVLRMTAAKKENMMATLKMIRDDYGSVDSYVRTACGFDSDDLAQIKKNLIVSKN